MNFIELFETKENGSWYMLSLSITANLYYMLRSAHHFPFIYFKIGTKLVLIK